MARSRLHELSEHGVSVWIDSLSREMLEPVSSPGSSRRTRSSASPRTRRSSRRRSPRATGTTSSSARPRHSEDDTTELFLPLAQEDIRDACDLLRRSGSGRTGRRLRLARGRPDAGLRRRRDLRAGTRFHAEVDRPNLYVKIPGTEPGLGAIEDSIADGTLDQRDPASSRLAVRRRRSRPTSAGSSASSRPAATLGSVPRSRASS